MARAQAPIIIRRIARKRHRARGIWKVGELAIAAAGFVALWQLLEAPGADERSAVADFVAAATATARADPGRPKTAPVANGPPSETRAETGETIHASRAEAEAAAFAPGAAPEPPSLDQARDMRDAARFARAEIAIRLALQNAPDLARRIVTERSAEGLRIRISDQDRAMFGPGHAEPGPDAQRLLAAISPAVAALPNPISICGHTEEPGALGDWGLSAARANAARKLLEAHGVPANRFYEIAAKASGGGGVAITLLRNGVDRDHPDRASQNRASPILTSKARTGGAPLNAALKARAP